MNPILWMRKCNLNKVEGLSLGLIASVRARI